MRQYIYFIFLIYQFIDKLIYTQQSDSMNYINNDNNTFSHKEKPLFNFIIFISFLLLFIYLYSFIFKENQTIKISHFKSESKSEFISKIQIYKIDSNYKTVSPNDNEYIYIPVIGTNDFHGSFFPVIKIYIKIYKCN